MALSVASFTGTYLSDSGAPAQGEVDFWLSSELTNGSVTVVPETVTVPLDASGDLAVGLCSTLDAGTEPTGVLWRIVERLTGADPYAFFTAMPSGDVDLSSLRPFSQGPPEPT